MEIYKENAKTLHMGDDFPDTLRYIFLSSILIGPEPFCLWSEYDPMVAESKLYEVHG
jgi:hypothetical protein